MKATTYNIVGYRLRLAKATYFMAHAMTLPPPVDTVTITETENGKEINLYGMKVVAVRDDDYYFHAKSIDLIDEAGGYSYTLFTDSPTDKPFAIRIIKNFGAVNEPAEYFTDVERIHMEAEAKIKETLKTRSIEEYC